MLEPATPYVHSWHIEAVCDHLTAVSDGRITRLLINIPPGSMKSLLVSSFWPSWEWGARSMTSLRYLTTSFAEIAVGRDCRRMRDLIMSDWYQKHWPDVQLKRVGEFSFENTMTGSRDGIPFGSLTSKRGDRLIIDDPHSVIRTESKLERQTSVRKFREGAINRLNDQKRSAIVVVMQRLHSGDISGEIMDGGMGYVTLVLPMEYESGRHCQTEIGFSDPRSVEGELLCPQRWPKDVVDDLKRDMGVVAWCTPEETPILMGDLSMKRIVEVEVGDEVIGFDLPGPDRPRQKRRLCRAIVTAKSAWVRPVVKITLDSGRVIRCTADHRWYTGRKERWRKLYHPAAVGGSLLRICDPDIEVLTDPEAAREAGWLAGFFDGEGSVSLMHKLGRKFPPSSLVSFYQGADRNLHLCERLSRFGFDFGLSVRQRPGLGAAATPLRHYWLRGNDLPMFQRFLHVIRPMKWRERMIQGALGTAFVLGREKVVKIEPDGEEEVFGLTTTTGNYVAWGLASQNSAQYQQRPVPRGGGILPYNGWEYWSKATAMIYGRSENQFPDIEYCLGILDTAYTEKQENDYSGFVVLGLWHNLYDQPQVMVMHVWRKRLKFHDCVDEVIKSATKMKCDRVLIENKASGISVFQEIVRLTRDESFAVQLVDPKGEDKEARANSVSHFLGEERDDGTRRPGMVWVPCVTQPDGAVWPRVWAEMLMAEASEFPKGKHDDLVDTFVHGMRFLRMRGLVRRTREVEVEHTEALRDPGVAPPP